MQVRGEWAAGPLAPRGDRSEAARAALGKAARRRNRVGGPRGLVADAFAKPWSAVRTRWRQSGRLRRLEAIIEIAQQWNRTRELEPLLVQMAEAATQLFQCDRASIFLWDRPNRALIGRPALGVKGGELRVADDRGVVGRVLQSGQPLRVDDATQPGVIDHQADAETRYRTRTLLCVAMDTGSGERWAFSSWSTSAPERSLGRTRRASASWLRPCRGGTGKHPGPAAFASNQPPACRPGGRGRAADRPVPGDRVAPRDRPPRGRDGPRGAHRRRERHRQRGHRPVDPLPEPPPRPAVHRLELRRHSRTRWPRASSSVTRRARSPTPARPGPASSSWPPAARCSSTRSAI